MIKNQTLINIINSISDGVILLNKNKEIIFWNRWMDRHSEFHGDSVLGTNFFSIFPLAKNSRISFAIDQALSMSQSSYLSHTINPVLLPLFGSSGRSNEKTPVYQNIQISAIKDGGEKNILIHIVDETNNRMKETILKEKAEKEKSLNDKLIAQIKENKTAEEKLKLSAAVIENTKEGVLITDTDTTILSINHAFTGITGYTPNQVIGKKIRILKSGKHNKVFYSSLWKTLTRTGNWTGEFINKKPDGSLFNVEASITAIKNDEGRIAHYVNIFRDITERKKQEEMLIQMSSTDPLTGLANRRVLEDRLELHWKSCHRHRFAIGVIMFDADHFKLFNDHYGHRSGDKCLVTIAKILQKNARRGEDVVARYGGEEFIIVIPDTSKKGLETLINRIFEDLKKKKIAHKNSPDGKNVTLSAGAAWCVPEDTSSFLNLLDAADQNLYQAKNEGRNRFVLKEYIAH